uniref:Zgc:77938 n=1 Tax=Nothobranchius furzeri TaxID=105023 RepID=A0A8C6KVC1_NOTFU
MAKAGQVIKCKAAVAWEQKKPLSIEEVLLHLNESFPDLFISFLYFMQHIFATGLCHTDWEYLYETGKRLKFRSFPLVLGHEAAGVVESVGPEIHHTLYRPYTLYRPSYPIVIPLFLPFCGKCDRCQSSKTNFLLPDTSLAKVADAPLGKVCLLGTGYGAAINSGKCALFGLGAVGMAAIIGCKNAMAKTIIGVDTNPQKFEKARLFGATECISPNNGSKSIQEVLVEKTTGGVDVALECVGKPDVMIAALESTAEACGTCVIAGRMETETMSVPVIKILMGRTLKGTYFGGWKSVLGVPKIVDDYMSKKLKLDEFITHTQPLNEINTDISKNLKTTMSKCPVPSLPQPLSTVCHSLTF